MKVRASVKPICEKCKVIKRHGKVMVICKNLSLIHIWRSNLLRLVGRKKNVKNR